MLSPRDTLEESEGLTGGVHGSYILQNLPQR